MKLEEKRSKWYRKNWRESNMGRFEQSISYACVKCFLFIIKKHKPETLLKYGELASYTNFHYYWELPHDLQGRTNSFCYTVI